MIFVSRGNHKLDKSFLIFNLPTVVTCPNCKLCKTTCYAKRSEKHYPKVLLCRQNNYKETLKPDFTDNMIALIKDKVARAKVRAKPRTKGPIKYVRVHEAGDFYSREYFLKWCKIAEAIPGVPFVNYTKAFENTRGPTPGNLNIVKSITPDGKLNFGSTEFIKKQAEKYHGFICPYGIKKNIVCGRDCIECARQEYVFFLEH